MDIQVDSTRMVRMLCQDMLGNPNGVANLPLRSLAIRLPVIPGREVHNGINGEHCDLRIVRKTPCGFDHRLSVGSVKGGPLCLWGIRIAGGEGIDESLFPLAEPRCERLGLRNGGYRWTLCSV